jgi:general secretion pathway protein L
MTLQELLNADVSSIGQWARQGFAWWIDELSTLLPVNWRDWFTSRTRRLVEPLSPSGWRQWQNGKLLTPAQADRAPKGGVGLILPADAVLLRRLEFPRVPLSDIRRMVALDIDRLSPLAGDLVYHDVEILDRDAGGGKQTVLLGVTLRETAARYLGEARAAGFAPVAMGAAREDGAASFRFDFLPAFKTSLGENGGGRVALYWWAAVAFLLVANLAGLVVRDMLDVGRLRHAVDDQQTAVAAATQLQRRVQTENVQRSALVARQMQSDPLHVLDALTRALPASAWVQRLEWNGQTLRVVGFRSSDNDPLAALRASPAFVNPRAAGAAVAQPKPGESPPFDITADVSKRARP